MQQEQWQGHLALTCREALNPPMCLQGTAAVAAAILGPVGWLGGEQTAQARLTGLPNLLAGECRLQLHRHSRPKKSVVLLDWPPRANTAQLLCALASAQSHPGQLRLPLAHVYGIGGRFCRCKASLHGSGALSVRNLGTKMVTISYLAEHIWSMDVNRRTSYSPWSTAGVHRNVRRGKFRFRKPFPTALHVEGQGSPQHMPCCSLLAFRPPSDVQGSRCAYFHGTTECDALPLRRGHFRRDNAATMLRQKRGETAHNQ